MHISQERIKEILKQVIGEPEAEDIIFYLRGKSNISEFIITEELDLDIHRTRKILYKLHDNNIVSFKRKKDKIKGWYICYWDFNENSIPILERKVRNETLKKLQERLEKETNNFYYMCRFAHTRLTFDDAFEEDFKCPECGELMNQVNNDKTLTFLKTRIAELTAEVAKDDEETRIAHEEIKQKIAQQKQEEREKAAKRAEEEREKAAKRLERQKLMEENAKKRAELEKKRQERREELLAKAEAKKLQSKVVKKAVLKKPIKKVVAKPAKAKIVKKPIKKVVAKLPIKKKAVKKVVAKSAKAKIVKKPIKKVVAKPANKPKKIVKLVKKLVKFMKPSTTKSNKNVKSKQTSKKVVKKAVKKKK